MPELKLFQSKKLISALLFVTPFIVFYGALTGGFVYDDNVQVVENSWIRDAGSLKDIFTKSAWAYVEGSPVTNFYRPVMHLVLMGGYHAFGLSPAGYHAINIALHGLNSIMVFAVASRLLSGGRGLNVNAGTTAAAFAGAVFAVHPVNSEAASWVAALPELTYTFFVLAAVYLHVRYYEGPPVLRYSVVPVLFFLALLSKETGVVLPLIMASYDLASHGRHFIARRWKAYVPLVAVSIAYMALRFGAIGGVMHKKYVDLDLATSVINIFPLFARYMGKLLMPSHLSAVYSIEASASILDPFVITGLLAVMVYGVALFSARKDRLAFPALSIIAAPLLPVLYMPAVSIGGFADRYLYLPSAGFSILAGAGLLLFREKLRPAEGARGYGTGVKALYLTAVVILMAYSAASFQRGIIWRSDLSLWSDAVSKFPGSLNARYNLAWTLHTAGESARAVEAYREVLKIDPDYEKAHYNLAVLLQKAGDREGAIMHYSESIRIRPDKATAYYNLAHIYHTGGDMRRAVENYERALGVDATNADAHFNLAAAYEDLGDFPSAEAHYTEALRLNPRAADAHLRLGRVYKRLGLLERAVDEFSAALSIDPGYSEARYELNSVSTQGGRP